MKNKIKNYRNFVYKLRFSLELEAEFPNKIDTDVLKSRYKKLLNSWTVVDDGSVTNGLEFIPKNKNKLYFKKESFAEISEVLHIIRKHNGKVSGKSCGLHFHVNARKFTSTEILKIVNEVIAKQTFIIRDFKVRQDRLNDYCWRISKKDIKGLTPKILDQYRRNEEIEVLIPILESKYYMLNLQALVGHGSLEFRMANGTKYLRDIKKYVKYLFEFIINSLERE